MTDINAILTKPSGKVRVVIDTDAYNEIDDQYAISYALNKLDKLQIEALYAVPFFNMNSASPKDGMEKSYDEIKKLLKLLQRDELIEHVYKGSENYLCDEKTPQESEAARDLVKRAMNMPEDELLYVVSIGAITNVASAILMQPAIAKKMVVVWLGGHAHHWRDTKEFNMIQDIAAVRVVFDSGVPLVQVPCWNVASHLSITEVELREYVKGKSIIGDYLYKITCDISKKISGEYWSRIIWDIAPFMWLAGPEDCTTDYLTHSPIVSYEGTYSIDKSRHLMKVVDYINRDMVFEELFHTLQHQ